VPLYDDDGNELTPDEAMQYLQAQQQATPQQQGRPFVRDLEQRLNQTQTKAQQAEERATAAERKLAFVEAGVPLTQPDGKPNPIATYFVNGYQGEVNPDAIRAEATALGLLQPAQQAPTTQTAPPQQAVFGQMAEATQGQVTPGTRDYDAEIKAAGAARDRTLMHSLVQEKAQAEGRTTPGVVYD
jgi:hypothetical protein